MLASMKFSIIALSTIVCLAQDSSVSINVHGAGSIPTKQTAGFRLQDVHPRTLIQAAYGVQDFQILGGPGWIDSDRYDVQVLAPGQRGLQALRPKVQGLLKEKFKLEFHREKKELPVYTLRIGRDGPRMWKTTEGSCVPFDPSVRHPRVPGEKPPEYCGLIKTGVNAWLNRTLDGVGVPMNGTDEMPGLVMTISRELHRTVIDKTGLTAKYDFHLEWDRSATPESETHPDRAGEVPGPSLIRAVEDQLGLKIEPGKAPVEVLVIDRIEKPPLK